MGGMCGSFDVFIVADGEIIGDNRHFVVSCTLSIVLSVKGAYSDTVRQLGGRPGPRVTVPLLCCSRFSSRSTNPDMGLLEKLDMWGLGYLQSIGIVEVDELMQRPSLG